MRFKPFLLNVVKVPSLQIQWYSSRLSQSSVSVLVKLCGACVRTWNSSLFGAWLHSTQCLHTGLLSLVLCSFSLHCSCLIVYPTYCALQLSCLQVTR